MNFRGTAILCIIAILGVVAAVFTGRRDAEAGVGAPDTLPLLLLDDRLPVGAIERITLNREGEPTVVFAAGLGDDAGWRQVEPFVYPMDAFSMQQLAVTANSVRVIDRLDPDALAVEGALDAIELDPPRVSIRFEWPGNEATLELGRRGLGGLAYLRRRGADDVYVVTQDLHDRTVDTNVWEWRDRTIFRNVGFDCDRVEITSRGSESVLVRDRKQWRLESPVATRLSEAARDELLQALGRARVAGFVIDQPEDLSSFGLDDPVGVIAVSCGFRDERDGVIFRETNTQRLVIGARMGMDTQDRFGRVDGRDVVIRVPEAVLQAFFLPPERLIAGNASGIMAADVKSIRIFGLEPEVVLERDLDRWIAPEAGDRAVPVGRVATLLATLTRAQAAEIRIQPYPRDHDVATITMFAFDGKPLDSVQVARETDGRWVLSNGDGVLRVFPASLALPLTSAEFGLR